MSQQQVAGQTKSWELSLYELHRTPQEVLTDDTVIAISPRSLHSELMCPICLDMLTNTMTTKECLHRFCHDCIITALRAGNKECPTCRKKLISKRSLRHDPNFDSLIAKIYPDREEYEADQEKALERLHQHTNQQALTASIEEGLRIQTKNRLQRMLKQQRKQQEASTDESPVKDEPATSNDSADIKLPGSSGTGTPSKKVVKRKQKEKQEAQTERGEVELLLHPHPDSAKIVESRYIKTTGEASVTHLCHFLTTRVSLEQPCDSQPTFRVHTRDADGAYTTLEATVTLFEISQRFAKENSPAELYYSIEPETQES